MTSRLTALAALILAGFALTSGLDVARFGWIAMEAQALAEAGGDAPPLDRALQAAAAAADLAPWRETAGLRDAARGLYLASLAASGLASAEAMEQAASDALAVSPTASLAWILLAEARLRRGAPTPDVLAALALSQTTGPRESGPMWLRARLALRIWADLDAAARRHALTDLAALRRALDGGRIEELRRLIAAQPAAARADMRALWAATPGGADMLRAAGL